MPVHVRAPARPGRYRLSIDLVHEHVRWFGDAVEWAVDVPAAHRVALDGHAELLDLALDRIHLQPEVEPVVLPSLSGYLLAGMEAAIGPIQLARLAMRTTRLLRRARRLREGKPAAPLAGGAEESVEALARCSELVVVGPDWERNAAVTRQLGRLAATVRTARALGLAVEVNLSGFTPRGLVDRLLTRLAH